MSKENKKRLEKEENLQEEQHENKLTKEQVMEIVKEAKDKGNITYAELANKLGDISVDDINKVYDAFDEAGVDVLKDDFIEPEIEDLENVEEIPLEELENPNFDDVAVDDPVRMYLREIVRIPLLSYDEEAELAERILQNDEDARKKLCQANLRFA